MKRAILLIALAATASAQQPPKNVQVLKDVPPGQIIPAMAFIANSLGVACTHCHVDRQWELDEKPAKEAARRDIRMTRAINEAHFGGKVVVTCNTCHAGKVTPAAIPLVAHAGWNRQPSPAAQPLPALDAVLEKQQRAIGDAKAARTLRGSVTRTSGRDEPKTEAFVASIDPSTGVKIETELPYPPEAKRGLVPMVPSGTALKVAGREVVRGRSAIVVEATSPSGRPERLFFDEASGQLVKRYRETQTALGVLPEEYDYDDYRSVAGSMVPFFMQWSRADYRVTYRVAAAQ